MGGMKLSQSGIGRVSVVARASVGEGDLAVVMVRSRVAMCVRGIMLACGYDSIGEGQSRADLRAILQAFGGRICGGYGKGLTNGVNLASGIITNTGEREYAVMLRFADDAV